MQNKRQCGKHRCLVDSYLCVSSFGGRGTETRTFSCKLLTTGSNFIKTTVRVSYPPFTSWTSPGSRTLCSADRIRQTGTRVEIWGNVGRKHQLTYLVTLRLPGLQYLLSFIPPCSSEFLCKKGQLSDAYHSLPGFKSLPKPLCRPSPDTPACDTRSNCNVCKCRLSMSECSKSCLVCGGHIFIISGMWPFLKRPSKRGRSHQTVSPWGFNRRGGFLV